MYHPTKPRKGLSKKLHVTPPKRGLRPASKGMDERALRHVKASDVLRRRDNSPNANKDKKPQPMIDLRKKAKGGSEMSSMSSAYRKTPDY